MFLRIKSKKYQGGVHTHLLHHYERFMNDRILLR